MSEADLTAVSLNVFLKGTALTELIEEVFFQGFVGGTTFGSDYDAGYAPCLFA